MKILDDRRKQVFLVIILIFLCSILLTNARNYVEAFEAVFWNNTEHLAVRQKLEKVDGSQYKIINTFNINLVNGDKMVNRQYSLFNSSILLMKLPDSFNSSEINDRIKSRQSPQMNRFILDFHKNQTLTNDNNVKLLNNHQELDYPTITHLNKLLEKFRSKQQNIILSIKTIFTPTTDEETNIETYIFVVGTVILLLISLIISSKS